MKRSRRNGWAMFAATMLFVVGAVNIVQGLAALFTPAYFVAAEGEILIWSFVIWGMILGIWGIVLVVAGAAMLSGMMWARVVALVVAAVNAFAQLAFVDSHPVWSVVAIAFDVLIVYAVTAGWHRPGQDAGADAYAAGRADARAAPAGETAAAGRGSAAGDAAAGADTAGADTAGEGAWEQGEEPSGGGTRERVDEAGERSYGGASTYEARQAAAEHRPPGTRPGKHEQPMS